MNLNKGITSVAIAAMLLSMTSFTSEAETIRGIDYKKYNNLKVVKIPSKHYHSHDKFIGENRYETSAKILDNYKSKDKLILVDASRNMSDGLSAAALSGKLNANIVPINPKNIDESSEKMIKNAKEIVLIGGYNAISKEFEKNLSGKKVIRIAGKDRVETSENIAKYIGNYKKAYIVNGYTGQADAMSIAPVSARDVSPIILTKANETSIEEKENTKYTIIGGTDVVSDSIQQNTNSDRIGGKNRYETNRMVLDKFYKNRNSISFCNGETLVDALSGTYFARNHGIALINKEENLNLLKNINTNQLGGLPLDIRFVVPSSNATEKINDKNTNKNENKNPDTEKNTSGEEILDGEQTHDGNPNSEDNQASDNKEIEIKSSDMLVEGEDFNKEIRSLKGFSDAKKIVFNNKIPNDIDKIEHLKLDKERSGNIVAYIKDNTIYISSNEKIYANEYSYALMKDLKNIEEVDLSNLDTSKVVDISSLFNGCSNLKTINVDNLNTSKVKNMSEMFTNCNNLKEIDLEDIDTENVENMSNMFFGCFNLEKLDLSNFKTSKVEDMSRMFAGCSNLKSVDLEYLNTSNVTNMDYMLYGCYNLNANINIENVVSDYNKVFEHCSEEEGSKLTVNYTNDKTKMIAENMIKTKSDLSNIVLGNILKSKIDNNKNND